MLGQVVRDARNAHGYTQEKLSTMAGVSRRHLAALEKGANVSVLVVKKVAAALELRTIDLGEVTITAGDPPTKVNVVLLNESLREARRGAIALERMLSQAERLSGAGREATAPVRSESSLPLPLPLMTRMTDLAISGMVREEPSEWIDVPLSAEVEPGQPMAELPPGEVLQVPPSLIDEGDALFRVRGTMLEAWGIAAGDVLIAELRPSGRANTGEMVLALDGGALRIGRWWNKRGAHRVQESPNDLTTSRCATTPKVFAAVNHVLKTN